MNRALELMREAVRILEEQTVDVAPVEEVKDNTVELGTMRPGEVFKIAEYDFIVLKHVEEGTVVISKDFMAEDKQFDSDSRNYNHSSLKELIESEIQPIIEAAVGADNLVEHGVDLTSVDMQDEFGVCISKVRPLTFDEAREFNDLLVNKDLGWYWTCTPWSTAERGWEYSLAVVSGSGNFDFGFYYNVNGVRPVCILKSNIFVSRGEA